MDFLYAFVFFGSLFTLICCAIYTPYMAHNINRAIRVHRTIAIVAGVAFIWSGFHIFRLTF